MSHKLSTISGTPIKEQNPKYPPKKSTPKGIDPAYPQKNFVKACYDNKGDTQGFYDYMYSGSMYGDNPTRDRKPSNFGHSIGQRAGKLRLSGNPGAHIIGKRSK